MLVELLVNEEHFATLVPKKTTTSLHVQSSMPMGGHDVTLMISEGLDRRGGPRHALNVGDVIEVKVVAEAGDGPTRQGAGSMGSKGDGRVTSPEPRFAIDVNGVRAAVVGTPAPGGLSVDVLVSLQKETTEISLRAKGRTHDTYWQWGFPYLQPGDHVRVEVMAPGPADAPSSTEPRVSSPGL